MHLILGLILLGLTTSSSWAGKVPEEINYQGNLREKGVPMNKEVDAFFRITNASGSKVYWSSDSVQKVKVVYGNFSVLLKPTGVKWDDIEDPHLEVVINQEVLLPREPLRSSVYSLVSGKVADGNITKDSLNEDLQTRIIPSGFVGMFKTDCPKGWSKLIGKNGEDLTGRFPRIDNSFGILGGNDSHNHGGNTGEAAHPFNSADRGGNAKNWVNHVHTIQGDSNVPKFVSLLYCVKN